MAKIILPIKGMHCKSCEILVGDSLKQVNGISNVKVSCVAAQAEIHTDKDISQDDLEKAVSRAGYQVGKEGNSWLSVDWRVWRDFCIAVVAFALIWLWLYATDTSWNFAPSVKPENLLAVWLIGLTAGFSTCMALTGGLLAGLSARHNQKHPELNGRQKFVPHLYFNFGRLVSYFVLGGAIGIIGAVLQISPTVWALLTIIVGLSMLFLGLQLSEIFPKLNNLFVLPSGIFNKAAKGRQDEYSHFGAWVLGVATFFLPCGFTQAMQLYAMSSGSFWAGAIIMLVFALGTMVGLLLIGVLTSTVKGGVAKTLFRLLGILVVVLALINLLNGWNLLGGINLLKGAVDNNPAPVGNNSEVQIIKATFTVSGDINPNNFTVKVNQPVRFEVTPLEDGVGCMSTIMIPGLYRRPILLTKGQTAIMEFTPTSRGTFPITCAMGISRGNLIVQ